MFFKNLSCYRFTPDIDLDAIAVSLAKQALRDCGPLELATHGFVPPLGGEDDPYTHTVGDFILITVAQQERLLPADVVRDELRKRIEDITEKTGRRVYSKECKRLKDEIHAQLLPRAFIRTRKCNAYFSKDGWLVIDSASRKVHEHIVQMIREAAGSFPCVPLSPEESPRALMTDWVILAKLPKDITLGDECELRDPAEDGAVVRASNQDLVTDEVREHLKSGKQVFRLGLVFAGRVSFVLDHALTVRKLRFLDQVQDELGDTTPESASLELSVQFAQMAFELKHVLDWMAATFGISAAPKLKLDGGDAPKHMRDAKPTKPIEHAAPSEVLSTFAGGETDDLLPKAIELVREAGAVSISYVQRVLKVGYNRAASLVETMETKGVVSAPDKAGKRTVIK